MAPEDVNFIHRLYDGKVPSTLEDCNPLRRRILLDIADAIQEEYQFDDERTVLMDFACGTGSSVATFDY
ncbi:hypothetical protein FRB90_000260 [Tulasnella sp. 427]|nr:hypothetical protein FRB90_000260 [Tulasnella sp. 427]